MAPFPYPIKGEESKSLPPCFLLFFFLTDPKPGACRCAQSQAKSGQDDGGKMVWEESRGFPPHRLLFFFLADPKPGACRRAQSQAKDGQGDGGKMVWEESLGFPPTVYCSFFFPIQRPAPAAMLKARQRAARAMWSLVFGMPPVGGISRACRFWQ